MHSLSPSLVYTPGSPSEAIAWTEDGTLIPFQETTPGVWAARDGRVASLVVNAIGSCAGTSVLTLGNGTVYTYGQVGASPCTGARQEGRIQRIDRPNGEYLLFSPNTAGFISTVTSRSGATVSLQYQSDDVLDIGVLEALTAPDGQLFTIVHTDGFPDKVYAGDATTGTLLWDLTFGATGSGTSKALLAVFDGEGNLENGWDYTDSNSTRVLRECGPGGSADCSLNASSIAFAYPTNSETSVAFTAADGTTTTNTWTYASQFSGDRPRVTSRKHEGSCPGCGSAGIEAAYWTGTSWPRRTRDANGIITVYQDLDSCDSHGPTCDNQTQREFAYDGAAATPKLGNPIVVYEGCSGPDIDTVSCAGARRVEYTYRAGTRVIESASRPSAGGGGVQAQDSRTFDGASARVLLDRRGGRTADALDGVLNDQKTRTIKYTYGGGAGGIDITRIDGPFDDTGSGTPSASDSRTDIAYYAHGSSDACSLQAHPENENRIRTVTRFIDATRTLVTKYCDYDAAGRPRRIKDQNDVVTDLVYNWRGQVTSQTRTLGSSFETLYKYDANGNLIEVRLPRVTSNGREGLRYTYDDADRVLRVEQGYYYGLVGSSFTALQSLRYSYDAWGNRTKTEWLSGPAVGGTVKLSQGAQFDAFNRLVCLARPFASDCSAAAQKTEFAFDAVGNLLQVRDAQGDDLRYGGPSLPASSPADPPDWAYDQFGKITRVQQEICLHPASSPDGACIGATLANVDYLYDAALQLESVVVNDSVRGGQIVTSYVTDDFGSLVKVVSPDGGTSFFRYDGAGRLFETIDARLKKYRFTYDRLGRLVKKTNITSGEPGVAELTFCYDGEDTACGYLPQGQPNKLGRLTAVKDAANRVKYVYDAFGRMTIEDRTFPGTSTPAATSYTYDDSNNRATFTTPLGPSSAGGLTLHFVRDEANRITAVNWSGPTMGGTLVREVQWEPFGPLASWKRGIVSSNTYSVSRDDAWRITGTSFAGLISDSYAYANDGNVKKIPSATPTPNILHDSLSRITQDRSASGTQAFGYDDAGNRVTHTGSSSYTYSAATNNRLATAEGKTFGYDPAGNVTARVPGIGGIGYSDEGRVTSIATGSGTTTYIRDHRGLRVQKAGAGGSGSYFFDPEGQLIHWQGPVTSNFFGCKMQPARNRIYNETYLHLDGRPTAVIRSYVQTACGGSTYNTFVVQGIDYYYTDKMGMPRGVISDATGALTGSMTFDSFGNPLSISGSYSVPFRLPGQFALSAAEGGPTTTVGGLHENWNRVYDSIVGRYLQPDPLGFPNAGEAARLPNLYAYAESAPLERTDPTGLYTLHGNCPLFGAAANLAAQVLGPPGPGGHNYNPACNPCRNRFPGCNVDQWLQAGGDPPVYIFGGTQLFGGYQSATKCTGQQPNPNLYPYAVSAQSPGGIYINADLCYATPQTLAQNLLQRMFNWCECEHGEKFADPNDPDTPGSGNTLTKKVCK